MRSPDYDFNLRIPLPPFWLIAAALVFVVVTWIPLVLIARRRVTKHSKPRIHMVLDMDNQAKYKAQSASPVFADGRAMRPQLPGTIARGHLEADDHYYRGYRLVSGSSEGPSSQGSSSSKDPSESGQGGQANQGGDTNKAGQTDQSSDAQNSGKNSDQASDQNAEPNSEQKANQAAGSDNQGSSDANASTGDNGSKGEDKGKGKDKDKGKGKGKGKDKDKGKGKGKDKGKENGNSDSSAASKDAGKNQSQSDSKAGSEAKADLGNAEPGGPSAKPKYFNGLPDRITLNRDLLETGRRRFNIYCAPCHGQSGYGNGAVQQHASTLIERGGSGTTWTQVANLMQLTQDGKLVFGPKEYPDGKVFNTITNGKGAMAPYGPRIRTHDRWAIVAYLRALQMSQSTKVDQLTKEQRAKLNQKPRKSSNSSN